MDSEVLSFLNPVSASPGCVILDNACAWVSVLPELRKSHHLSHQVANTGTWPSSLPHTGSESGFFSFRSKDTGSQGSGGRGRSVSPDGAGHGPSHAASWVLCCVLQVEVSLLFYSTSWGWIHVCSAGVCQDCFRLLEYFKMSYLLCSFPTAPHTLSLILKMQC